MPVAVNDHGAVKDITDCGRNSSVGPSVCTEDLSSSATSIMNDASGSTATATTDDADAPSSSCSASAESASAEVEAYVPYFGRLSLYEQRELARQTKNAAWTSYRRCSSSPTSTTTNSSANYCAKAPQSSSPLILSTPTTPAATNLPPSQRIPNLDMERLFSTIMNARMTTTTTTTRPLPQFNSTSTTTILSNSKKEDLRKFLQNNSHKPRSTNSNTTTTLANNHKKKSLAADILLVGKSIQNNRR